MLVTFGATLEKEFYAREPQFVAKEIVGKNITVVKDENKIISQIIEVEAYGGLDDPGSYVHKPKGKRMFCQVGKTWLIKHRRHNGYLFNFIAHQPNGAGAVLIRAIQIVEDSSQVLKSGEVITGPVKVSQALSLNNTYDNVDAIEAQGIFVTNGIDINVVSTTRVNVPNDDGRPWRFTLNESSESSVKPSLQTKTRKRNYLERIFQLLNEIKKHPGLTTTEYAANCSFDDKTTHRMLNKLRRVGMLRREAGMNASDSLVYRWFLRMQL